jgi:hypothetical protein
MFRPFFLSATLLAAAPILAQTSAQITAPTLHTAAELQQLEAKLTSAATASPSGAGIGPIDNYGTNYSLLVVRVHTGDAEQHQLWADQMVVDKGTITLITGGTMTGEHPLPGQPGETRGSGIEGGKEVTLHPGDIAHIPAGIPHWVKIAPGTTTTYLVFKEK